MKVLYVSKASCLAAHRDKVAVMSRRVDLILVVPERWGRQAQEPVLSTDPRTVALPALFHGHNHLHFYRGLAALLDVERPDLVHADEEPYSAVTGQVAALCAKRAIPFVFFAWQNLAKRLPPPFGVLKSAVFARAAGGIAGTERAGSVLRGAGFTGPLAVIPQMGVDPERFRPDPVARARVRERLGIADGTVVLGYVGRLVPEKGVDLILAAAAEISGVALVVVGSGPDEDRLRRLSAELGIADRTHLVGSVPSTSVSEWLAALDILVLPSLTTRGWREQFGRVLVEAMACGLAVVGSDSGEIPSVIGDAGVVVEEGSAAELRAALKRLLEDGAERARLGEAARARVVGAFSQNAVVEATLTFHRRVVDAAGAQAARFHPRPSGWLALHRVNAMRLLRSFRLRLRKLDGSELDRVIPPEITEDRLHALLTKLAGTSGVRQILEIGSSSGEGSTAALVRGAERNPGSPTIHCLEVSRARFDRLVERYRGRPWVHCHNTSSVNLERFLSPARVELFYREKRSRLNRIPLREVLRWLEQDVAYVQEHGLSAPGIQTIKRAHGIERFDLVLIDGSEFTGTAEMEEVYGARWLVLDNIRTLKNLENYERLLTDPAYRLVEESPRLRNGFAAFEHVHDL